MRQALAAHGRDGLILTRVVRALLRARAEATHPRTSPFTFPLTEEAFVRVARRAGMAVGQKHTRHLIRLAISTGLIVPHGSYTSTKWRYVRCYRLGCRITRPRHNGEAGGGADGLRFAQEHTAVGSARRVKDHGRRRRAVERVPWWLDGLIGTVDGLPPPEARGNSRRARRLRRWRPKGERAVV